MNRMSSAHPRPDWATLPNLITLLRLGLVVPIVILVLHHAQPVLTVVLLAVFGASDWTACRIGDPARSRNQAGDHPGGPLRSRLVDRRDTLEPVTQQRPEILHAVQSSSLNDAREKTVDVVPVSFEPAQLRGEDPEGVCLNELVDRLRHEASGMQEGDPAFLPGDLRDGVVLGRELLERAPEVLLDRDRVVRGELCTGMLQDPVEDAPGGVLQILAVLMLLEMMLVGGDVDTVGLAAAGHRDVEGFARHFR